MALMLQVRYPLNGSLPPREFRVWAGKRNKPINPWEHVRPSRLRMRNSSRQFALGSMDGTRLELSAIESGAMNSGRFEFCSMDEGQPFDMEGTQLEVGHDKSVRKPMSRFHTTMNKVSKWLVISAVAGTILWRRFEDHALWAIIGATLNGGISMVLKQAINQERPPTANGVKEDPGMPSTHSQAFSYLAAYAALALFSYQGINFWSLIGASGILLSMTYFAWLRVADGLHTGLQVLVGGAVGVTGASLWLWTWKAVVGTALESSPWMRTPLHGAFMVTLVAIYFYTKDWEFGEF